MIEAFVAVFLVALLFTTISFLTIEEDMKRKSERAIYILLIAIVSWPITLTLLYAPALSTTNSTITNVPLNCIANSANSLSANSPAIASCGTITRTSTVVTMTNTPISPWAWYSYATFSLGMTLLLVVFLWKFMLEFSLKTFEEGLDGIKKN